MFRRNAVFRGLLVTAALAAPTMARAQSLSGDGFLFGPPAGMLTVSGGFTQPSAKSDVFAFAHERLTLGKSDFATASFSANFSVRLSKQLYLQLNGGYAGSTTKSEFRDWVDNNDKPIEQETTLQRVPLMVGLRLYLTSTGRSLGKLAWVPARVAPYIAAGAGTMYYNFGQTGDFVDFQTLDVFNDALTSTGWAPAGYGAAGFDVSLHPKFSLTTELRYDVAKAGMSREFEGFNRIDLSGVMATVGLSFRY